MYANIRLSTTARLRRHAGLLLLGVLTAILPGVALAQANPAPPASDAGILHPAQTTKLLPGAVFFRGQSADVQMRNSGGVKYADGMFVLSALVDNSGYSSGLQQKYQGYFITEVALDINGHTLQPGAYGVGFLKGNRFVVMDLGAHDLFTATSAHDAAITRPTPLQILADTAANHYRLYFGRNYVVFSRAQKH